MNQNLKGKRDKVKLAECEGINVIDNNRNGLEVTRNDRMTETNRITLYYKIQLISMFLD